MSTFLLNRQATAAMFSFFCCLVVRQCMPNAKPNALCPPYKQYATVFFKSISMRDIVSEALHHSGVWYGPCYKQAFQFIQLG